MTNSSNSEDDSTDLNKIDKDITKHRLRAFLIIILVAVLYLFLGDKTLPESAQSWGTFGDFIGGILNPIFALFAFYWLTYSVRLQTQELKDTRKELQKAATAQAETATHQERIANLEEKNVDTQKDILELQKETLLKQIKSSEAQKQQIEIQNFESLFFELLKTKSDATNEIIYSINSFSGNLDHTLHGKNAIKTYINNFKSYHSSLSWESHYTENLLDTFGSYFRICYQIVKLIDNNSILKNLNKESNKEYSVKQKEYFDIFRSTLTQHEIELIFFNCLSKYGIKKFKKLVEKYGLFEPMLIDNLILNENLKIYHNLTTYAYRYNKSAFEENELWNIYFREIAELKINLDLKLINQIIYYMQNLHIYKAYPNLNISTYNIINEELFITKINKQIIYLTDKESSSEHLPALIHMCENNLIHTIYLILKYNINYDEFCNFNNLIE